MKDQTNSKCNRPNIRLGSEKTLIQANGGSKPSG